jgi:hypothetical protein
MPHFDCVQIIKGEYAGQRGRSLSVIQKRYNAEPTMHRVQLDGYPRPGGWNGLVIVQEENLQAIPWLACAVQDGCHFPVLTEGETLCQMHRTA